MLDIARLNRLLAGPAADHASWLEAFEAEVATFPMSKYCDQVNSMVHFLAFLDNLNFVTSNLSAAKEYPEQPF